MPSQPGRANLAGGDLADRATLQVVARLAPAAQRQARALALAAHHRNFNLIRLIVTCERPFLFDFISYDFQNR
jgi:hypothetical protein